MLGLKQVFEKEGKAVGKVPLRDGARQADAGLQVRAAARLGEELKKQQHPSGSQSENHAAAQQALPVELPNGALFQQHHPPHHHRGIVAGVDGKGEGRQRTDEKHSPIGAPLRVLPEPQHPVDGGKKAQQRRIVGQHVADVEVGIDQAAVDQRAEQGRGLVPKKQPPDSVIEHQRTQHDKVVERHRNEERGRAVGAHAGQLRSQHLQAGRSHPPQRIAGAALGLGKPFAKSRNIAAHQGLHRLHGTVVPLLVRKREGTRT